MVKPKTKRVTSRGGNIFEVDISDKALRRFGFRHGDSVKVRKPIFPTPHYSEWHSARIIGVARVFEWKKLGHKVLWVAQAGDRGSVSHFEFPKKGKNIILVKKMVTSTGGHNFLVDVSKKAVSHFGFRPSQKIKVRIGCGGWHSGKVVGVAREYEWNRYGRKVLWFSLTKDRGKVTYTDWSERILRA